MNQKNTTGVAYYRSLKRNIVLVVIMVSITPMILVSGLILYLYQNTYRDKTYAYLGEVVQRHKQNIDCFLKERLDDIRFLSRTFTFEELSEDSFLAPDPFPNRRRRAGLQRRPREGFTLPEPDQRGRTSQPATAVDSATPALAIRPNAA